MTVSQLAERTGVPPRRVRFYVAEELLPPPVGRGRASYYTRQHLERLQQIVALREVNLSLEEIRERLADESRRSPAADRASVESQAWRRWGVVPGVEIHTREDLDEQTLATVRVMVGAMRRLLENGDPSGEEWSELDE